jgi:cytochrome c peroxidase
VLTPRLDALASRAPYLHDGSAATLDDVLAAHPDADRAPSSWLSASQLDDLRTYLRSR